MKTMKIWILTAIILTMQMISFAHQDTPLDLRKDGRIKGLPEKYSSAQFDGLTFTLRINDKQIIIPECVKEFFKNYKDYRITFSASWYHDPELLPHYIVMDIVSAYHPYGCQVFFDLETLEIFQIWKPEIGLNKSVPNSSLSNEQEISEECHETIMNSITKTKKFIR